MASEMAKARAALRGFALGLPGAHEDFPWGESVAKVKGKVFVFLGRPEKNRLGFSVKLPFSRDAALQLPFAEPTGYGLGKSGWVTVSLPPPRKPPLDLFLHFVEESYRAVAPKALVGELDGKTAARRARPRTRSR